MAKKLYIGAALALMPAAMMAQSAIDAYNLAPQELRGTARFMSMGGAFTALGGDLSTLTQNPAGIGVYRGSDIGFTFDVNMMNSKTSGPGVTGGTSMSQTHVDVNNFGYVGTFNFGGTSASTLSWGVSYNRQASFHRRYRASGMQLNTSLSNYITSFTDGVNPEDLKFNDDTKFNPYQNNAPDAPSWLSVLAYNSGMITPVTGYDDKTGQMFETDMYNGLWQYPVDANPQIRPTTGTAGMNVDEQGYIDEYSINLGGSVSNVFYWGAALGITDLSFTQNAWYGESLDHANVPANADMGITEGNGGFDLYNRKHISGSGVNAKFGVILKPINELRFGVAVHTPTYWSLTTSYDAATSFQYSSGVKGDEETDLAVYDWNLHSPWKLMFGLAGVIGGRAIISADYEYDAYGDMKTKDDYGTEYDYFNQDIKDYFKVSSTFRIGAEFRVTPQFSVRAGYSYTGTQVKPEVRDNDVEVYTSGTNVAYTFDNSIQNYSLGIGYRYKGFYVDAAYVLRHRSSEYHAFTSFTEYDGYWTDGPQVKVTDNNSNLVFTVGYKF